MKPRKLTPAELENTNGGSNDAMSSNAGISLGAGSLLSVGYGWQQGNKSYKSNIEIGKDISADFHVLNLKTD